MSLVSKLKLLDSYPKIHEDFFTKTMGGGIITLVSASIMLLLFMSELGIYLTTTTTHELTVDTSRGETITIHVDITFPYMPCSWLSLDTMDVSGDLHLDADNHDVYKQRVNSDGKHVAEPQKHDVKATKKSGDEVAPGEGANSSCLSCYGAEDHEGQCCNTCDELRAAYNKRGWALSNVDHLQQCLHDSYLESIVQQRGEGCHMWGTLQVNKVAGNFHFAPGKSYQAGGSMHVHDLAPFGAEPLDFSHTVQRLAFGPEYPGMRNPLDGNKVLFRSMVPTGQPGVGMHQYFLKIVPTIYARQDNRIIIPSNQFSVTENFRPAAQGVGRSLPGVFFFYDLSPIQVQITETKHSFLHFITGVCAIVGGVFTVSGIVDAAVYQSEQIIRRKMELGRRH